MTSEVATPPSFGQGFALCSPEGVLLPHSFRRTETEAIASVFTDPDTREAHWKAAEDQGMTVEFVYARIFVPVFFAKAFLEALAEAEVVGAV